jgi:DNA-binding response OmpR family regulator
MKKILIVEDDQIVANIYRNKFSVDGFQVEIALDGQVGLEMIHSFRPDAVVMDLMLPKLTGVELMKKIRAEAEFQTLPVIVFSNTYLTNLVQEAWKAGATKCLSKANCTPRQVIDVVRSALAANGNPSPDVHGQMNGAAKDSVTVSSASSLEDIEFDEDLRQSFLGSLAPTLTSLRGGLQGLIKSETEDQRVLQAQELYRKVRTVTGNAAVAGFTLISHMSDAIEALLKELYEKPKNMNPSTLRTVATAIDFLGILFERGTHPSRQTPISANILVVDDEAISRRAITYALEKAKLKCMNVEDPAVAHDLLTKNSFDLVFLDVDMPGMNGYELCTKLRAIPAHKKTPVVFVTSLNDFENRANSTMSGGNDFIGKPFLFIELAVKALVYILRARVVTAR